MAAVSDIDPKIILRLREARQISVRYGRAQITVFRFGGLTSGDLGAAIRRFEADDLDIDELAWAFVRARVAKHTPSFSWEDVELPLLLDRVVGVSTDPKFESSTVEDVAATLVRAAEKECEAAERIRKRTQDWAKGIAAQFDFGLRTQQIYDVLRISRKVEGLFPTAGRTDAVLGSLYSDKGALSVVLGESAQAAAKLATGQVAQDLQDRFAGYAGVGGWNAKSLNFMGSAGLASERLHLAAAGFRAELPTEQMGVYLRQQLGFPLWSKSLNLSSAILPALAKYQSMFEASDWLKRLKRTYPENWRDLDNDEVDAAVKVMLKTGLCLAWVPRPSILRELLDADDDVGRIDVLEARSEEIIEDVESVLADITSPALHSTVEVCTEAIAAHRDGHTNPALAYASAALSDLVHGYFGEKGFGPIGALFRGVDPWNDVGLTEFPFYAVGRVWVRAMDRFEGNEDPGYNRNRTLHLIGDHYHEANLAAVLMLLTGLVRELHRLEARAEVRQRENLAAAA